MNKIFLDEAVSFMYNASKSIKYFHWNYMGKDFKPYHEDLDEVYQYLLEEVDDVAELGRQNDLFVNPFVLNELIVSGASNFDTAVRHVVYVLSETVFKLKALRESVRSDQTGTQSELDEAIYEAQDLLWKWSSALSELTIEE